MVGNLLQKLGLSSNLAKSLMSKHNSKCVVEGKGTGCMEEEASGKGGRKLRGTWREERRKKAGGKAG